MIDNYKQIFSREQIMNTLKNNIKSYANNNKNKLKSYSPYGQKLRESKKISLFYGGLSKKYLQKINYKNRGFPSKLSENIFIILESRLDVVLFRSGFFETIKSAKQMIRIGAIKVNNQIVISPSFFVTPGDVLSVFGKNHKSYNFDKKKLLPQKSVFLVKCRRLKKNSQNKATSLKEKIDFCKKFVKMKNQISIRKAIGSRYKGSLILLSIISSAFGYSRMLATCKNNISNFTTNTILAKSKIERVSSSESEVVTRGCRSAFTKSDAIEKQNQESERKAKRLSLSTSTYFDKNKSCNLSEKSLPLIIEKDKDYVLSTTTEGLCLVLINTIKSFINFKDARLMLHVAGKSLQKNYNDQTQKPASFFTRLMTFNNEIKLNTLFTYIPKCLVTEDFSKKQIETCFMFLNYLLNLKKQYSSLPKKKQNYNKQQQSLFFKNQSFFEMKKTKAPHLEVSYKSLSIVFLFPPQRVNFPFF